MMQEGAGVRQLLEDELRAHRQAPARPRRTARARAAGVGIERGTGGHGVTFISRRSVEADLAAGTLVEARVEGLELERDVFLVRATGRVETRAMRAFLEFAARRLRVIVRWSLEELPAVLEELGLERPFLVASPAMVAGRAVDRTLVGGALEPDRGAADADSLLAVGGGSAIDTAKSASSQSGLPLVSVPDDVLRRGVDPRLRHPLARPSHGRKRRGREPGGNRLRRRADPGAAS